MEKEIILQSLDDTHALGLRLGAAMPREAVCLFRGELAAGKTTLIKSICAGLGIAADTVISPTYTIANWYRGKWPVCHVDFYRLEHGDELYNLDPDDWLNPDGPTFIEWPDLAMPLLEGVAVIVFEIAPLAGAASQKRRLKAAAASEIYVPLFEALS